MTDQTTPEASGYSPVFSHEIRGLSPFAPFAHDKCTEAHEAAKMQQEGMAKCQYRLED